VVVSRMLRRVGLVIGTVALISSLAGPTGYALATAGQSHTGAIPSAGPSGAGAPGPGGGRPGLGATPPGGFTGGLGGAAGAFGGATGPFGGAAGPFGGAGGIGGLGAGGLGGFGGTAPGGTAGGLLDASTPSAALVQALKAGSSKYTWVAAAVGSNTAAGYQLAAQLPVMPIGGFNGSDPSPTLAQFQAYVAAGKIHYFIGGGLGGGGGGFGGGGGGLGGQQAGNSSSSEIASWVQSHFRTVSIGDITLYDLTQPAS